MVKAYNVFKVSHPRAHGDLGKFIGMFFDEECAIEYAAEFIEGDRTSYVIQAMDLDAFPTMLIESVA